MSDSRVIGDWGTSRMRLWRLEDGAIAERREGPGIVGLANPERALGEALGDWSPGRIVLCGMAGALGGLNEAPYAECPVSVEGWANRAARFAFRGVPLTIAAGAAWRDADGRPEVMRGEETQLFGAIALNPALASSEHCLLFPGSHSKWVKVANGRIESFRTFITGELFALLERSSLALAQPASKENDEQGFAAGLARAVEGRVLSAGLFEARAAQLRDGKSSGWACGFASGLLIGSEVRQMSPRAPPTIIGDPALTERYVRALAHFGIAANCIDGEECAIAGLRLLDADD